MFDGAPIRVVMAVLWTAALLSPGGAAAQNKESDGRVRGRIEQALANIQFARCADEKPCAPATRAEKDDLPITVTEARIVLRQGILNGLAQICGLDWQTQNYQPMIAYWQGLAKTDRQMALINILHGMAQGQAQALMGSQTCTDDFRSTIQAKLAFRP